MQHHSHSLLLGVNDSRIPIRIIESLHDSVLLLASVLGLVHVVVTVAFVILGYRTTLELAEPGKRSCLDEHFLETNRLVLRTIKHIRSILIEDDAFAHYVATLHYNEQRSECDEQAADVKVPHAS